VLAGFELSINTTRQTVGMVAEQRRQRCWAAAARAMDLGDGRTNIWFWALPHSGCSKECNGWCPSAESCRSE